MKQDVVLSVARLDSSFAKGIYFYIAVHVLLPLLQPPSRPKPVCSFHGLDRRGMVVKSGVVEVKVEERGGYDLFGSV